MTYNLIWKEFRTVFKEFLICSMLSCMVFYSFTSNVSNIGYTHVTVGYKKFEVYLIITGFEIQILTQINV